MSETHTNPTVVVEVKTAEKSGERVELPTLTVGVQATIVSVS